MDVNQREEIREGDLTRTIEEETAKIPSINWLALSVGSMVLSFFFEFILAKRNVGNFIGLWVPSLLLIGVYNKIVKLEANMDRSLMH